MDSQTPPQFEAMNVVEVRRHLNQIRKLWRSNAPSSPFYTSALLSGTPQTASEFCFRFVKLHHRQRDSRNGHKRPQSPP